MFKKILFATDGSETCNNAAKVAFALAALEEAKLIVFHVIGEPSRGNSAFITDNRTTEKQEMDSDYVEWVVEEMKNTYGELLENSENVTVEAPVGQIHREILRHAREKDVDIIIMGAHTKDSSMSRVGSNIEKITKTSKCPVLVINRPCPSYQSFFNNIVFVTDFSEKSDHAFELSLKLAGELNSKFHFFHAFDISRSETRRMSQVKLESVIKQIKKRIQRKYLDNLRGLEKLGLQVWEGTPYIEILKFAREKNAELIVMAYHNPSKEELGGVTQQIILRSACPVIFV